MHTCIMSETSLPDRHALHDIAMSRISHRCMTLYDCISLIFPLYSTPLATEGKIHARHQTDWMEVTMALEVTPTVLG